MDAAAETSPSKKRTLGGAFQKVDCAVASRW
jgi:hypothetical protein